MTNSFKLQILTPERQFYLGDVVELKTESLAGHIEILANHIPVTTALKPSEAKVKELDGKELKAFISNGILRAINNEVTILCDAAEWPEEINVIRAEESKKRAEERLAKRENINLRRAEKSLLRALIRLRVKGI